MGLHVQWLTRWRDPCPQPIAMDDLIIHLLERRGPAAQGARSPAVAGEHAAIATTQSEPPSQLPRADLCRLCGKRIETEDTVAAGGDDVLHTLCYDRSLDG